MSNRQQRRAAAREDLKSATDIHMAVPDRRKPTEKTLLDIAEEKRQELMKKHPEAFKGQDKTPYGSPSDFVHSEPLNAWEEAIVYSISLAMLHFTLDVLVLNQYTQGVVWKEVFIRSGKMFPTLFIAIYLLHTKTANRLQLLRQLFFFAAAGYAGCHLIHAGNKHGYYMVMQRAPPIGTVWIWSVVELNLPYAVVHVLVVLVYTWWNGFTTF